MLEDTNSLDGAHLWPKALIVALGALLPLVIWAPSSEFMSSSIPSWQILTAHAQPFRWARDLAFCLKVPLDSLLVWASSEGSGETARMRRLAWTFAARIGDKYQIRLTRSICTFCRGLSVQECGVSITAASKGVGVGVGAAAEDQVGILVPLVDDNGVFVYFVYFCIFVNSCCVRRYCHKKFQMDNSFSSFYFQSCYHQKQCRRYQVLFTFIRVSFNIMLKIERICLAQFR